MELMPASGFFVMLKLQQEKEINQNVKYILHSAKWCGIVKLLRRITVNLSSYCKG